MHCAGTVSVIGLTMAFLEATDEDELMVLQQDAEEIVAEISQERWVESAEHRGNGVMYVRGTQSFGPDETGTYLDLALVPVSREGGAVDFGIAPVLEWAEVYPFLVERLALDDNVRV